MKSFAFVALLLLALPFGASAQGDDLPAFMRHLFAPELIFENADAIGLSEVQREEMMAELKATQLRATEAQFATYEAVLKLNELARADVIDEQAMLAAARAVFEAEGKVKEAHLSLLVRLRNALDAAQREKLAQVRDGAR